MIEQMHRLMAFSLAMTLVAGLMSAAPVMAQPPEDPATEVTIAAGINADTVDGKHAVSAKTTKKARANKLVATDQKGLLPSNILKPLWSLMVGIPPILADGQVTWGEIVGIPAGLADGQDEGRGYVSKTDPTVFSLPADGWNWFYVDMPIGADVDITVIPTIDNGEVAIVLQTCERLPGGTLRHYYVLQNMSTVDAVSFKLRTRVYDQGIDPAALNKIARNIDVGVKKGKKRP